MACFDKKTEWSCCFKVFDCSLNWEKKRRSWKSGILIVRMRLFGDGSLRLGGRTHQEGRRARGPKSVKNGSGNNEWKERTRFSGGVKNKRLEIEDCVAKVRTILDFN